MSPSTAAIAIVCKVPMPGRSKTRLIPRLGAERAADLSRARAGATGLDVAETAPWYDVDDAESHAWSLDERAGHPPAGLATRSVSAAVGSIA